MKKNKVGRPKIKDCTKSFTVALKLSEAGKLRKKHGTLTKAIKTLL